MTKINISQQAKENFKNQIMDNFQKGKKFAKKENKQIKWEKSLSEIDKTIKSKLKGFKDKNIDLETLILADYAYIEDLVDFINKNSIRTQLSTNEKDIFLTLYKRLKKAEFIRDLDIKVCPYCNRNYIFNFEKSNKQKATAQLDHFFDKNKYPFLAVSLYNLVPSCSTCNQRKSTIQKDIFYPYKESFNNHAKFKYSGVSSSNGSLDFFDEKRIEIELSCKDNTVKEKVKNHIEVFNIINLYNEHKDIVSELLKKRIIYSDDYIEDLLKNFEGTLFKNREDLLRLITNGYMTDEEINKRPLSKLIKDISDDVGLL